MRSYGKKRKGSDIVEMMYKGSSYDLAKRVYSMIEVMIYELTGLHIK